MCAGTAFAQTSTSRISGTVTDPSGAVIPGATVTAINEATGVTNTQVTTESGFYAFTSLPVGTYTIKVELQGFKTSQLKGNVLEIGSPIAVNVVMQVGGVTEIVNVEGGYEKLESSDAKIGNVGNRRPLNPSLSTDAIHCP
jgi:hypothetical protein